MIDSRCKLILQLLQSDRGGCVWCGTPTATIIGALLRSACVLMQPPDAHCNVPPNNVQLHRQLIFLEGQCAAARTGLGGAALCGRVSTPSTALIFHLQHMKGF